MYFQILSHAGLLVKGSGGKTLICDPWLIGSSYWRSWWNYPPVDKELIANLVPDYIYLTHIHWDHFHGPSLEKFDKSTMILVPKGNYSRIKDDLGTLGFKNVFEMKHGESFQIDNGFKITCYQFGIFLDSAPLIECDGINLLNLNDSKHMGPTLKEIIKKHPNIDFVFRSHSSANSRLSYEIIDGDNVLVDDVDKYIKEFALTAQAVGAKYAIPFASNHCHLHKDSFKYNPLVQTPVMVREYFEEHNIKTPEVVVMISGDKWDSKSGFVLSNFDWFTNREQFLEEYKENQKASLEKFYNTEDTSKFPIVLVKKYFEKLAQKIPFFLKWLIRKNIYTYVLYKFDKPAYILNVNIAKGEIVEIDPSTILSYQQFPIQIHTTSFIFVRCIAFRIFSHMAIGKRVFYKVTKKSKPKMELLNLIYNLEEYNMIPLKKNFSKRSIENWLLRYRELYLYVLLLRDKIIYRKLDISKYLKIN
jgi:UDP-MurNAc hydroxylase